MSTYSQSNFIFETDIESLQINLIAKFGERVNLGLIDPFQIGLIEWARRKEIIQNWKILLTIKLILFFQIF
jgi:phosphosulfolactate synthase (CoM biosynthesis protein A)